MKEVALVGMLVLAACSTTAADPAVESSIEELQDQVEEMESVVSELRLAQVALSARVDAIEDSVVASYPSGPSSQDVGDLREIVEGVTNDIGILRTCLNGWLDQIDARFNGVTYTLNYC